MEESDAAVLERRRSPKGMELRSEHHRASLVGQVSTFVCFVASQHRREVAAAVNKFEPATTGAGREDCLGLISKTVKAGTPIKSSTTPRNGDRLAFLRRAREFPFLSLLPREASK